MAWIRITAHQLTAHPEIKHTVRQGTVVDRNVTFTALSTLLMRQGIYSSPLLPSMVIVDRDGSKELVPGLMPFEIQD